MFEFVGRSYKLPPLSGFCLESYSVDFSLDRLVPGVDNIRCDVYLSPTFVNATQAIVAKLLNRHAGLEKSAPQDQRKAGWAKEVDTYKQHYTEVMRDALNKAKGGREIQIENLARGALVKMLLTEIQSQYALLLGRLKKGVRHSEIKNQDDLAEASRTKGKLQRILQEGEAIRLRVGMEICGFWSEVEKSSIRTMREAVFGSRTRFFEDLLESPLLHHDQPDNDFQMLSEYNLVLGRRIEDPDRYPALLFLLRFLLNYLGGGTDGPQTVVERRLALPSMSGEPGGEAPPDPAKCGQADVWLKEPANMDRLFNWQRAQEEYRALKKQKADPAQLTGLKMQIAAQKQMLHFFYRQFIRAGLMERIAAFYEIGPEYSRYCPPLLPQQIVQYLIQPKARKVLKSRLKRMHSVYSRPFPLHPLNRRIKSMERMTAARRKDFLARFMSAFARYHRDRTNLELIREAMERINIATQEKILALSRENNTLYEFLLPHEHTEEKAPIIRHVVIKADVRGSTDITFRMSERGLNPASYFSLNFFDPISSILADYEASKVFIEGDALILSILERQGRPEGWYGVARACGLALNMLMIIQRYNRKSVKFELPILELGIGISYIEQPPAFLFDGGSRIMISPAINQADRLSGCSKTARRMLEDKKSPFNLHVFQTHADQDIDATADDLFLRYNVNGIELNPEGFKKLSEEIDLSLLPLDAADRQDQKTRLYSGKFPTKSGRYQRLVIREARIPVIDPESMKVVRVSSRVYYEVCTNPKLYSLARRRVQP